MVSFQAGRPTSGMRASQYRSPFSTTDVAQAVPPWAKAGFWLACAWGVETASGVATPTRMLDAVAGRAVALRWPRMERLTEQLKAQYAFDDLWEADRGRP